MVKSFKLVPRPLNKDPRSRQIKLRFSLHGITLEGKPIGPDLKKASRRAHGLETLLQLMVFLLCFVVKKIQNDKRKKNHFINLNKSIWTC